MEALHSRRTYDYRIQEAICETGDRDLFPELKIPRSTIRSWIHRGPPDVIAGDLAAHDYAEMAAEIERLRCRTALFGAVVGLLIALFRASKVQLDGDEVTKKLADARKTAREKRMKENRAAGCSVCVGETESGALLLQRARSRMS